MLMKHWISIEKRLPPIGIWIHLTKDVKEASMGRVVDGHLTYLKQCLGGYLNKEADVAKYCKDMDYTHWRYDDTQDGDSYG